MQGPAVQVIEVRAIFRLRKTSYVLKTRRVLNFEIVDNIHWVLSKILKSIELVYKPLPILTENFLAGSQRLDSTIEVKTKYVFGRLCAQKKSSN